MSVARTVLRSFDVRNVAREDRSLVSPTFAAIVAMYVFAGVYYRGAPTFLPDFLQSASSVGALSLGVVDIAAGRWLYSGILLLGALGQVAGGALGATLAGWLVSTADYGTPFVVLAGLPLAALAAVGGLRYLEGLSSGAGAVPGD